MSVSVTMPQLGESVTEGTVTRWLKKEGEHVTADEPLLEVSTDKVDTEIPSPATGVLRGIVVDEDETVAVGAQLAVIEDAAGEPAADAGPAAEAAAAPAAPAAEAAPAAPAAEEAPAQAQQPVPAQEQEPAPPAQPEPAYSEPAPQPAAAQAPAAQAPAAPVNGGSAASGGTWTSYAPPPQAPAAYAPPAQPAPAQPAAAQPAASQPAAEPEPAGAYPEPTPLPSGESPYVTPLVRKLAAEHAVPLESISGTGVGGRIRKQDVLEAARQRRAAEAAAAQATAPAAQPAAAPAPGAPAVQPAPARPALVPSALRGTTQRMSRPRQVIAKRMVESLQVSAQLTTVVEADVTNIARLRQRAKAGFEAREGVKLTFLPFFAQAALEALKVHPKLNAVINAETSEITYHDAEHLGIAVDTERGLMVPVIHNAGDLNIGGLARKISDLAARTRSGQVGPDELAGGTFTLTNTGSRGALFDTPIINQPQVGILGVGTVVKRPVVVEDPALDEVIAVRSMVYLALTYDHRLVDGADAARFLGTVKNRLEEGAFEAELGL
ncbi:MAG TPA: 2-oxoglutarate dehydrogenase, E2 component, dihydrolipoamide succinyltransferase [Trebonia sp.]|jgi:2-oxoglutarate dehydrogenase E2 component (dihydrolipoamide succinyltransferase)